MTTPIWKFPAHSSGLTDYHSIPTESALDSKLETFTREVLQNANDQGLQNGNPVKITFQFNLIEGEELNQFLETLDWNDGSNSPNTLRWHVERATENEQARDPGLRRFLSDFDREQLLVLTIHDENTTGLRGNETDNGQPYGALVKDFGGTEKPDSSSGGSHGLGKTVLWAFSGVSTVLFNSSPDEFPEDGGDEPPRLVGRSILPAHAHEDEGKTYTNHGWFGREDDDEIRRLGRPPSLWGDCGNAAEVAETLQVDRPNEILGTSIGVIGFRVPGEELRPDPSELATALRRASIKYFWPAMARDDLEVYVEMPDGARSRATWEDAPGVKPFVNCYQELFNTDTAELSGPGSYAKTTVELTVPREGSDTVDDPHSEIETSVDVVIRALAPGDETAFGESDDNDLGPNRVARLRGAQMVVDYVDMGSAAKRGTDFSAVLVAGEAQARPGDEPTDAQRAVEQFLKRSEPTQHDDWQGSDNDYLKKHYVGTTVSEINALDGNRLEATLADVVQEEVEPGNDVPGVDDIVPVMDGRDTNGEGNGSALEWETRPDVWFDGNKWQFFGEGGPTNEDHADWAVEVELVSLDSRGREDEPIEIVDFGVVSGSAPWEVRDGVGRFEASQDTDQVAFEGGSRELGTEAEDPSEVFDLGKIAQTRLKISAEVREGDS